jgi:hypothetical protein
MFSSPPFGPLITRAAEQTPTQRLSRSYQYDRRDQGRDRPGRHQNPTPARPAPIAEGPITINRGGHSSESDATESAAYIHIPVGLHHDP